MLQNQKYYPKRRFKEKRTPNHGEAYGNWGAVVIRSEFLTMARELANHYKMPIGNVAMLAIERDFREVFGQKEVVAPLIQKRKVGRPRKGSSTAMKVPDFSDIEQANASKT
jgi:hypothetical protein